MKKYKDIEFDTYIEMRDFLYKEYGRNKDENILKYIKNIGEFVRKEADQNRINFWKNLNIEFNEARDVPPLNLRGEDYQKYIIPALIRCGAIQKKDLEVGKVYYGDYRNANIGLWDGKQFEIERFKFGHMMKDKCYHFEDDDGFALFVPLRENYLVK